MSGSWRRATTFGATLALALTLAEGAGLPAARAAAPVVVVFLPVTGVVGTSVTITGTGFHDSSVATGVTFNGTAATSFTVDSDTQITATVPVGATTGPVSVTDGEGTGASAIDFVVTPSPRRRSFSSRRRVDPPAPRSRSPAPGTRALRP